MLDYRRMLRDIQANPEAYSKRNYNYTLPVASIAAAATSTFNLLIDANAPFVWTKTTYFCDIAGAVQTDSSRVIPLITLQLTDSGSGQPFFDRAQNLPNIAGHQGLPQILEAPYIFGPSSSLNAVFTNYSAATTYVNLQVSLLGYRVFQYSGPYAN